MFYTLLCQQDGEIGNDGDWFCRATTWPRLANAVDDDRKLGQGRRQPAQHRVSRRGRPLHLGKAPLHINGVWEVPTMVDLAKQGKLFDWGAIECRPFQPPLHLCGFALLRDPATMPASRSRREAAAVLEVINWIEKHMRLFWATAGHIPAYMAVTDERRIQGDAAEATYARAGRRTASSTRARRFAGVASPLSTTRPATPSRRRSTARRRPKTPAAEMIATLQRPANKSSRGPACAAAAAGRAR